MNLHIDTTERNTILLKLDDVVRRVDMAGRPDQQLLGEVDWLLAEQGRHLTEINSITVNPGPGSFTGTRVGVAVANALGLALAVPVNGADVGNFVTPVYGAEANIGRRAS